MPSDTAWTCGGAGSPCLRLMRRHVSGRALSSLEAFTSELGKLDIGKVLGHKV
jgi:hypothetical protein